MKKEYLFDEEMLALQQSADLADTSVRLVPVGVVGHQGDVYVHPVDKDHPHGPETDNGQVAAGSTKGSRHVVEGDNVKMYTGTTMPSYMRRRMVGRWPIGPLIEAPDGFMLTHPSHARHQYPPGIYQITLQLDVSTMTAVLD